MADNIPISTGSGEVVASDQRTINDVSVQVQRVDEQGATAIATGQVSVGTSVIYIVTARDTRKSVTIVNQGTGDIYVGPATVSSSNGFKLSSGAGLTIRSTAAVQGISASGTQAVNYIEEYDA